MWGQCWCFYKLLLSQAGSQCSIKAQIAACAFQSKPLVKKLRTLEGSGQALVTAAMPLNLGASQLIQYR